MNDNKSPSFSVSSKSGRRSWLATLGVLEQYLAPHHLLTRWMQRLTRVRAPWFKNRQISWFVRRYQVDMSGIAAIRGAWMP